MHIDSSLAIGWILFLEKVRLNMRWDGTAGGAGAIIRSRRLLCSYQINIS